MTAEYNIDPWVVSAAAVALIRTQQSTHHRCRGVRRSCSALWTRRGRVAGPCSQGQIWRCPQARLQQSTDSGWSNKCGLRYGTYKNWLSSTLQTCEHKGARAAVRVTAASTSSNRNFVRQLIMLATEPEYTSPARQLAAACRYWGPCPSPRRWARPRLCACGGRGAPARPPSLSRTAACTGREPMPLTLCEAL